MTSRLTPRVELYSPDDELEVLLLKSILEAADIDFFVHNDTFGALTPGPAVSLINKRTFLVPEDQLDEARAVLRAFLTEHKGELHTRRPPRPPGTAKTDAESEPSRPRLSWLGMLLFGWLLPSRPSPPPLTLIRGSAPDEPAGEAHPPEEDPIPSRRGPPELRLIRSDDPTVPEADPDDSAR